jgi:Acetyl-CoA hydrolase/transferase C-terminal domain
MPEAELAKFQMTAVSYVNELYGAEAAKRRSRRNARFINNAMMATLMGDVISDGLANGQVVSGVGGQYNFVSQAFALDDARAIIVLRSKRSANGKTQSNILWNYPHTTIPRHLRDIVITEYGIADLRGKSDRDVIAAMLAITDSRYQGELLRQSKDAGKIEGAFDLPKTARENTPDTIEKALRPARDEGLLPPFPFGTDFTDVEQRLLPALQTLKAASPLQLAALIVQGASSIHVDQECLARMGLERPSTPTELLYALLLRGVLTAAARRAWFRWIISRLGCGRRVGSSPPRCLGKSIVRRLTNALLCADSSRRLARVCIAWCEIVRGSNIVENHAQSRLFDPSGRGPTSNWRHEVAVRSICLPLS